MKSSFAGARRLGFCLLGGLLLAASGVAFAQTAVPVQPPLPPTISDKAKAAVLANAASAASTPLDLAGQRTFIDNYQQTFGDLQRKTYAVDITESSMAGVPVRIITAKGMVLPKSGPVLLNLHGGGFMLDSGSRTENIPIAALTRLPVVAVRYRLAPEHPYPAGLDDAVAVYRELLKTHKPGDIALYGTSAGAILGPEVIVRLRAEGLPLPAALGVFAGDADLSIMGDQGVGQKFDPLLLSRIYLGKHDPADPAVSPGRGDLHGFPPTMCMTSTRDILMSPTVSFCRELEVAGVENKLVVFDGLPHAFWSYLDTPESDQAFQIMARFLASHVERTAR